MKHRGLYIAKSLPESGGVYPMSAAMATAYLLNEVLRATRPVAALAVPEANEVDLPRAEAARRFEHPEVVLLVRIVARHQRPALIGHDMQAARGTRRLEARMPVAAREVDGLHGEGVRLEWQGDLEPKATPERNLGKQQITATSSATDGKILRA